MNASQQRSAPVVLALAVAVMLGGPTSMQAQDAHYTTVTGRLDPNVEVRAQVDLESHGDRWLSGHVGAMSVPVTPVNIVSCTMIALPELSPEPGAVFMISLRDVNQLQVRHGEEDTWAPLDLEPLLEAEPQQCREVGAEGGW